MILMYHKVYPESPTKWWVTVDEFYRQMSELSGYDVVYLDDYNPGDSRQAVITFDGVYKNIIEYASPILKHFNYPFELFITGDYIGRDNAFDAQEPFAYFADMAELKKLVAMGGRLQWHSHTHQNMKLLRSNHEIAAEISVPEQYTSLDGRGFTWFAYPHGDFNDEVMSAVSRSFSGAVSCVQGDDVHRFQLNRLTAVNQTSLKKNTVAVIVASYNYGSYLIDAVESVLRQTILPDEILIADDCSSDNTQEIASFYQNTYPHLIQYSRNSVNLGIVDNFNKAVSLTHADYIVFLGADNTFPSNYIEETSKILDGDETVAVAYTDFALFGPRANLVYATFNDAWKGRIREGFYMINFPEFNSVSRELLKSSNFIHGSSMFKRAAFEKAGGYRCEETTAEDHNLFLRIVQAGYTAKKTPGTFLEYRQHSREQANIKSVSHNELLFYKNKCLEIRKALSCSEAELAVIKNSYSYRVGHALLTPIRAIKKNLCLFKKGTGEQPPPQN